MILPLNTRKTSLAPASNPVNESCFDLVLSLSLQERYGLSASGSAAIQPRSPRRGRPQFPRQLACISFWIMPVRGHNFAVTQIIGLAGKIGDRPSRFAYEQHARRRIPRIQAKLPKAFEPPAGHRSQIQAAEPARLTP